MAEPHGPDDLDLPRVALPGDGWGSERAIHFLVAELVRSGHVPAAGEADILAEVFRRERLGSTGIGHGVSVPHCQSSHVKQFTGVVGTAAEPFFWPGTIDGRPVGVVCLIVMPDGSTARTLRDLERVVLRLRFGLA